MIADLTSIFSCSVDCSRVHKCMFGHVMVKCSSSDACPTRCKASMISYFASEIHNAHSLTFSCTASVVICSMHVLYGVVVMFQLVSCACCIVSGVVAVLRHLIHCD